MKQLEGVSLIVVTLLVLCSGPVRAQGRVIEYSPDAPAAAAAPNSPTDDRTTELDDLPPPAVGGRAVQVTPDAPVSGDANDIDDHSIDELTKTRARGAVDPTTQLGLEIDNNLVELQSAMSGGASTMDILSDEKMRKTLQKVFEHNPMAKLPLDQLKPMLERNLKNSNLSPLFQRFPGLLTFMTNLMHHPNAIGKLVSIANRREDLRNWSIGCLALMVVLYFIKRKLVPKTLPWWRRFLRSIGFSLVYLGLSLGSLSIIFYEELSPTYGVIAHSIF